MVNDDCRRCGRVLTQVRVRVRGGTDRAGKIHPDRHVRLCSVCAQELLSILVDQLPGHARHGWPRTGRE